MNKDLLAEFYFASSSEQTLPSKEIILSEIDKCFPIEYSVYNHVACHVKATEKITISYDVRLVDSNRYKISLYCQKKETSLAYALVIGGILLGGFIGYSVFDIAGALIGGIAGLWIIGTIFGSKEPNQVAEIIAIK